MPILIALLSAVTLVSLYRRAHWPAELLTHFRPHLIVAGLGGAALCLLTGERWGWALISLGLALGRLSEVVVPPVPLRGTTVWGIGLNYHAKAALTGRPVPDFPTLYIKPASALAGIGSQV